MWAEILVACRTLRRSPVFAATAIATLALGIGASSAIFSIVHAVVLRPLPFRDPEQLVRIWEAKPDEGIDRARVAAANVNDWRARSRAFDDLALFSVFTEPTVLGLEDPSFAMSLLLRSALPIDQIVPSVRSELRRVSADLSAANVRALDQVVGEALRSPRFNAFVLSAFATSALLLSALGVFGVFAFGVASRVREVGIRLALGATASDIAWLFLRQTIGPIAIGLIVGTAGAMTLGRLVSALLFGVTPTDLTSYTAAAAILVALALVASYLPVRRALRANPARALTS